MKCNNCNKQIKFNASFFWDAFVWAAYRCPYCGARYDLGRGAKAAILMPLAMSAPVVIVGLTQPLVLVIPFLVSVYFLAVTFALWRELSG